MDWTMLFACNRSPFSPPSSRLSGFHAYLALVWHEALQASSLISARGEKKKQTNKRNRDQNFFFFFGQHPSSFPVFLSHQAELGSVMSSASDNHSLSLYRDSICTDQWVPLKFSCEEEACKHITRKKFYLLSSICIYSGEFCTLLV